MSSAHHLGLFLDMAPRSRAIHPLVQRLGPSLCPASASDIPLSARGSALHCSIGDIFKTQRGIPHPTGLWKRVFWETSHPKPGANGQPGTTRAARGDQQLMASRWKWHRPPSAFLLAAAALWEVGKTQDALCHSTSIWISGFWILRGSPDALSDHHARPAQIPPCTSCLRKKAARPLARHPLDAGPLSALEPAQQVSLSIGPGTRSRRRSLGLEKDWQPFKIQSEQPTCRNPGRSPSLELGMPNRALEPRNGPR